METSSGKLSLVDRYDIASEALRRIRLLSGLSSYSGLNPEELEIICDIIFETAENACESM